GGPASSSTARRPEATATRPEERSFRNRPEARALRPRAWRRSPSSPGPGTGVPEKARDSWQAAFGRRRRSRSVLRRLEAVRRHAVATLAADRAASNRENGRDHRARK